MRKYYFHNLLQYQNINSTREEDSKYVGLWDMEEQNML